MIKWSLKCSYNTLVIPLSGPPRCTTRRQPSWYVCHFIIICLVGNEGNNKMKVITKFEEDTKSQGKSNFRKRYLSQHFVLGRYISLVRSIPYHSSNLLCNFSRFHSAHNRGGWVNSFHQKERKCLTRNIPIEEAG